jgi:hypothetical protein
MFLSMTATLWLATGSFQSAIAISSKKIGNIPIGDRNDAVQDRNVAVRDRNDAVNDRNVEVGDRNVAVSDRNEMFVSYGTHRNRRIEVNKSDIKKAA